MTGMYELEINLIQKLLSLRRFLVDIKSVFAFGFVQTHMSWFGGEWTLGWSHIPRASLSHGNLVRPNMHPSMTWRRTE